jgi:hypothetical protein
METMNQLRKTIKGWDQDLHEQNVSIALFFQHAKLTHVEMANGRHHLGGGEAVCSHGGQLQSKQGESKKDGLGDKGWYQGIIDIGAVRDAGRNVDKCSGGLQCKYTHSITVRGSKAVLG